VMLVENLRLLKHVDEALQQQLVVDADQQVRPCISVCHQIRLHDSLASAMHHYRHHFRFNGRAAVFAANQGYSVRPQYIPLSVLG